jgi:hypothetical protein
MRGVELGMTGGKASSGRLLAGVVVALLRLNDVTPSVTSRRRYYSLGHGQSYTFRCCHDDGLTPLGRGQSYSFQYRHDDITPWVVDKLLLSSWLISLDVSLVAVIE